LSSQVTDLRAPVPEEVAVEAELFEVDLLQLALGGELDAPQIGIRATAGAAPPSAEVRSLSSMSL
jgi:hypothetical protein